MRFNIIESYKNYHMHAASLWWVSGTKIWFISLNKLSFVIATFQMWQTLSSHIIERIPLSFQIVDQMILEAEILQLILLHISIFIIYVWGQIVYDY